MKINIQKHDWSYRSKEAKEFIERCLQPNPRVRMTINEALKHKWMEYRDEEDFDEFDIQILERILRYQKSTIVMQKK
jgi:serine/threonine protein kinase